MAKLIEARLGVSSPEGWYRVRRDALKALHLSAFLSTEARLLRFLQRVYPDHEWNAEHLSLTDTPAAHSSC